MQMGRSTLGSFPVWGTVRRCTGQLFLPCGYPRRGGLDAQRGGRGQTEPRLRGFGVGTRLLQGDRESIALDFLVLTYGVRGAMLATPRGPGEAIGRANHGNRHRRGRRFVRGGLARRLYYRSSQMYPWRSGSTYVELGQLGELVK